MSLKKYTDKKGNEYPNLYIDNGIFYAVGRKGDAVIKKSLKTREFNEARSRLISALHMAGIESVVTKKTNMLLKEYWAKIIFEKTVSEIKPSTLERIDIIWRLSLDPFWGNLNAGHITQDKVTEFMAWHQKNRPGVQFVNVFKYLGNLFKYVQEQGDLPGPRPKLTLPKNEEKHHSKKKGRILPEDEFKAILKHLDGDVKLIAEIARATGMRQMEIGGMEADRVKRLGEHLIFVLDTDDTKTGLAREIPIPLRFNAEIELRLGSGLQYLFARSKDDSKPIFPQIISKQWQKAKRKAGIKGKFRFHDLRHMAGTDMATNNINPIIACTILGMSLRTYQKIYLNLSMKDLILATETLFAKNEALNA